MPIKNRVQEVTSTLDVISFSRVYREFNTRADQLSEEADQSQKDLYINPQL